MKRYWIRNLGLCVLLCALGFLSLAIGASGASLSALFEAGAPENRILLYVRLPRTLAAALAGASLALAGYALQCVLGNPLAAPGVVGVNAGAGLCFLLASAFFPGRAGAAAGFAFLGALLAVGCVNGVSALSGAGRDAIVLSGVAVSALMTAGMDALVTVFPDLAVDRTVFSIGGFSAVTASGLRAALPFAALGMATLALLGREMRALELGDEIAGGLGLRVKPMRALLLFAAALLAGSAVSYAGLLGFVGLVVPHTARFLTRPDGRGAKFSCAALGACLCLAADLAARTLFLPYEFPVGVLLSAVGVPFFLYLLIARRRHA